MKTSVLAAASFAFISPFTSAATIFFDNFDSNPLGTNQIPAGWTVTDGTVDVIGSPDLFDLIPGNGRYIDLDGNTFDAGILSRSFNFVAGSTYTVTFDLAGSHRGTNNEIVDVTFGTTVATYTVAPADPFTLRTMIFTPNTSGIYALLFSNRGGDEVGALLDNVTVSGVPEPASASMFSLGLLGVLAAMSRRFRRGDA